MISKGGIVSLIAKGVGIIDICSGIDERIFGYAFWTIVLAELEDE